MPPESTPPEGQPPVFVLGAPRSGTTLVYKMLCLHPDVAYISNWVRRCPQLPRLSAVNRLARRMPSRRTAAWFADGENAYVYGRRRPLSQRLFPTPVEGEPLYRRHGLAVGARGRPRELAAFVAACNRVREASGARVFVSKRIDNNRRIPLLLRAFPDARFVVVVRDGRGVSASLRDVDWWDETRLWWWTGDTPPSWRAAGREPIEACARHWAAEVGAVDNGLLAVPADRVVSLRFEELVTDPAAAASRMATLAGLSRPDAWTVEVSRLGSVRSIDGWRERLSPEEVAVIEASVGDELQRLAYDG